MRAILPLRFLSFPLILDKVSSAIYAIYTLCNDNVVVVRVLDRYSVAYVRFPPRT